MTELVGPMNICIYGNVEILARIGGREPDNVVTGARSYRRTS
jgi:hypothetical protein